jgi:hypothetical protein
MPQWEMVEDWDSAVLPRPEVLGEPSWTSIAERSPNIILIVASPHAGRLQRSQLKITPISRERYG